MPVKLNLLPQNLQVSKGLSKVLKTIKAVNVIAAVAFIIFVLGLGTFFVISKISLSNLQDSTNRLKSQVVAQQGSEQLLVLIKDRLSKISSIKSTSTATKNMSNVDNIFNNLSPNSVINVGDIDPSKVEISLIVLSNSDLVTLMQNIRGNTIYKNIEMTSLGYAPGQGINVSLKLMEK